MEASDAPMEASEEQAGEILREIEDAEVAGDRQGLHEIIRKLDKWFAIEVWRLERDAKQFAQEWARAGLPRPGVDDADLPVERTLAARAVELHRKWARLVRTKVQDGIASATRRAGSALILHRDHVAGLRRSLGAVERTRGELSRIESETDGKTATLGFVHILGHRKFWALIVLLVCVDWVANVPVFHELLPREPGTDEMWANVVARSERYAVFGGLYRAFMRIAFAPEVALLALGVIAFLVFLAHVGGDAVRNLLAVSEQDLPDARLGIRAHRRQYYAPAVFGLLGAACVVFVLFLARERLERQTAERLVEAESHVTQLEGRLAAARDAGDLDRIGTINQELPQARATVEDRRARAEYAAAIQSMNVPITILNAVLLFAAALASYLAATNSLTERRLIHPKLAQLRAELERWQAEATEHRSAIRRAADDVKDALSHADRLLHSRPLAGADEKAQRLAAVIALFRSENAKERGIDPATIRAFQNPIALHVPALDAEEPFEAPAELIEYADEFRRLREAFAALGQAPYTYAGGDVP